MKQDNMDTEVAAEENAIKTAEGQLGLPSAQNMQLLQSTLPGPDFRAPGDTFSAAAITTQAAAAAPASFGKQEVGQGAVLAGLGDKAMAVSPDLPSQANSGSILESVVDPHAKHMGLSDLPNHNVTAIDAREAPLPGDALVYLMANLDAAPNHDDLTAAIQAVGEQIGLLNEIFLPILDGLNADVQSEMTLLNTLPTPDLGLSMKDDAGELTTTLSDLLGTIDVISSPQIDSLLSLGGTFEEIVSLVGSLPELDLSPALDSVVGAISDITEPVVDAIVDAAEPLIESIDSAIEPVVETLVELTEPVLNVLTETTVPLDDTVSTVTEPLLDTIEDLSEPLLETVSEIGLLSGITSTSSTDDEASLLETLSSGISSTAGSDDSALGGLPGVLDPNK